MSNEPKEVSDKELWDKLAEKDFEIRHAAGGPYDEIDIRNAFKRGCRTGANYDYDGPILRKKMKSEGNYIGTKEYWQERALKAEAETEKWRSDALHQIQKRNEAEARVKELEASFYAESRLTEMAVEETRKAVEAYKGELRRKIEERIDELERVIEDCAYPNESRSLKAECEWFLSLIGGEGETLKK